MDDAELAFLLSWVSDYYLDVVVTYDSDTAQALWGRKLKCLALDQVSPFTIQGR
jgi:small-conductance mechanosensitive channel